MSLQEPSSLFFFRKSNEKATRDPNPNSEIVKGIRKIICNIVDKVAGCQKIEESPSHTIFSPTNRETTNAKETKEQDGLKNKFRNPPCVPTRKGSQGYKKAEALKRGSHATQMEDESKVDRTENEDGGADQTSRFRNVHDKSDDTLPNDDSSGLYFCIFD